MRYLSVCSGIEAATVAWQKLGWEAAAFSDIEPFPRELLQHHYPNIPLHGDFTTIGDKDYGSIDLLVGGTPCQAFSVAGLRKGFADDRGNLTLAFLQLLKRKRPKWVVWENVPGVLSHDKGRTFGSFLGGLGELGYGFAYRVLDAQYFGVPQRRRRVFVIGCLGDWRSPAEVLFEPESLSGDITPERKKGQDVAGTLTQGFGARGVDAQQIADGNYAIAKCLTKRGAGGENHCADTANFITYGLAGNTIDRKPENGGNGAGVSEDLSFTLTKTDRHAVAAIPINTMTMMGRPSDDLSPRMGSGIGEVGDPCPTITKGHSHAVFSFDSLASNSMKSKNPNSGCRQVDLSGTIDTTRPCPSKNQGGLGIVKNNVIRRLTPLECERLQGFPDGYTKLNDKTTDSKRYAALGNSMAVPVMKWIGERINLIENH